MTHFISKGKGKSRRSFPISKGNRVSLKGHTVRKKHQTETLMKLKNFNKPVNVGFKNVVNGNAEVTLFADGRFPITKRGKLNKGRIRNAIARGSQTGNLPALRRAGLTKVAKKAGIKSEVLGIG